jgi:hypothetical protein
MEADRSRTFMTERRVSGPGAGVCDRGPFVCVKYPGDGG